jgi:hypothetical protein
MSTGNSKKIAVIGCSHFAAREVPCQGTNNWSYQLYKKYPQHQYRNYSCGGKGVEYFKLALLEAKKWGADIVFLNRTYLGRWNILAELSPTDAKEYAFDIFNEESNWQEMRLRSQLLWGNVHQLSANVSDESMYPWIRKLYAKLLLTFTTQHIAATETRRQYEWEWYSNVTQLYNFEHIFLIDWASSTHTKFLDPAANSDGPHLVSSNVNEIAVVDWFCKRYNSTGEAFGDSPLWKHGITISQEDNHLTFAGNKDLLENYILANKNVINALT